MLTLTEQAKMRKAHRLNYEKQARMPKSAWPRISPRKNIPEVDRNALTPVRACMEHPSMFPNEYRYLYRYNGKTPSFVWLDSQGLSTSKAHPSVVSAVCELRDQGWEDATW